MMDSRKNRSGVSLVEMVVIMAVVVFLLLITLPAMSYSRSQSMGMVCMANLGGMTKAWLMYADDNDDQFVGSATYDTTGWALQYYPSTQTSETRFVKNFVATPQDKNGIPRNDVVEDEIRGFENGGLWQYIEKAQVYHCPSDMRYLSPPDPPGEYNNGWGLKGGYRTYSIVAVYNGFMAMGSGWDTKEWMVTVYEPSEVVNPSEKFSLLEEHDQYGYNGNMWNFYLNTYAYWGDPFAIPHDKMTSLGYADGHAKRHQWQEESTVEMMASGWSKQLSVYPGEYDDIVWFRRHYIPGAVPASLQLPLP